MSSEEEEDYEYDYSDDDESGGGDVSMDDSSDVGAAMSTSSAKPCSFSEAANKKRPYGSMDGKRSSGGNDLRLSGGEL